MHTVHDIMTVSHYRGMSPGDRVHVLDKMGRRLSGAYTFASYKVNVRSGRAWIEVNVGGAKAVTWPYGVADVRKS